MWREAYAGIPCAFSILRPILSHVSQKKKKKISPSYKRPLNSVGFIFKFTFKKLIFGKLAVF